MVLFSPAALPIWVLRYASAQYFSVILSGLNYDRQAVLERYKQIQPRLLFAETEVMYGGKAIDLMPKVTEIVTNLTSHGLQRVILLPSARTKQDPRIPTGWNNW